MRTPIHISNVMPVDAEANVPTRVRGGEQDGRRIRVGVRSGAPLDVLKKSGKGEAPAAKKSQE